LSTSLNGTLRPIFMGSLPSSVYVRVINDGPVAHADKLDGTHCDSVVAMRGTTFLSETGLAAVEFTMDPSGKQSMCCP
jgi:hypothetical protein